MICPECQDTGSVPIGSDGPQERAHREAHRRWARAPLVKGGQGRSYREVEQSAMAIGYLTVIAFVLVCALVAVAIGGAA